MDESTHDFCSELARSSVIWQFGAGLVVLQVWVGRVTNNELIARHPTKKPDAWHQYRSALAARP